MSTNERPGMAVNEDELERHVRETREQAKRANYPEQSTPLHAKAMPRGRSSGATRAKGPRQATRRANRKER